MMKDVIYKLQRSTRDVRSEINNDDLIYAPRTLSFQCSDMSLTFLQFHVPDTAAGSSGKPVPDRPPWCSSIDKSEGTNMIRKPQ